MRQKKAKSDADLMVLVTGILTQFWRADDEPEELRVMEMDNWLAVLDGMSVNEVGAAWLGFQRTGPRSAKGALYRPDAGAIYLRVVAARVAAFKLAKAREAANAPRITEATRERISDEKRREIMREAYGGREPSLTGKRMPGGAE